MTTMRAAATRTTINRKQQWKQQKWQQMQWLALAKMVGKAVATATEIEAAVMAVATWR